MKQWRESQTQAETQNAQMAHIAERAEADIAALGQFSEAEMAAIIQQASSLPARADGYMDVETANAVLDDVYNARYERYRQTKRAPAAPRAGVAGQKQADLSTEEGRAAHMLSIVEAEQE
jgi:hypothetical protein